MIYTFIYLFLVSIINISLWILFQCKCYSKISEYNLIKDKHTFATILFNLISFSFPMYILDLQNYSILGLLILTIGLGLTCPVIYYYYRYFYAFEIENKCYEKYLFILLFALNVYIGVYLNTIYYDNLIHNSEYTIDNFLLQLVLMCLNFGIDITVFIYNNTLKNIGDYCCLNGKFARQVLLNLKYTSEIVNMYVYVFELVKYNLTMNEIMINLKYVICVLSIIYYIILVFARMSLYSSMLIEDNEERRIQYISTGNI
jgi:hypothetical protein